MSRLNLGVPTQNISRRLSTFNRDDSGDDLPEESSQHLDGMHIHSKSLFLLSLIL